MYREDIAAISTARTASGNSGIIDVHYGDIASLRCQLDVTAVSGTTPTLDVIVEDTLDGANFNAIGTFPQKTAAGRQVINIAAPFARRLRVSWTINGTSPNFTFSVIIAGRNEYIR